MIVPQILENLNQILGVKMSSKERKKSSDESNQEANLKIKRCRHGRIIVKDSSKKKLVQLVSNQQAQPQPQPPTAKSQEDTKASAQHDNNQSQLNLNSSIEPNCAHKVANLEASPDKSSSARSSMTFSTGDSPASDIYDPEGPVLPISPGDSPPLSPLEKAANHAIKYRIDDDDVPSSAVQLNHQEKYLQKLNRQERVVEEVKIALRPHYQRRAINKEQYKDVLRRAVPKVRIDSHIFVYFIKTILKHH